MKKRGLSPVIATVLLIAIVVVLALIVFLWARGFITETVSKTILGEEISGKEACEMLNFEASLVDSELSIINKGNVPIYTIRVKTRSNGKSEIEDFNVDLGSGASEILNVDEESFSIIPVIIGRREGETRRFVCEEQEREL